MVSIHRIPFVVYLTIRVLCFIFRLKREAHPSLASRFQAPENCPIVSKRATPNFTPIHVYHTLYTRYAYRVDTPQANEHNSGCIDTTYPTSFFVALFLTMVECFLRTFELSKPKRKNTPLSICLSPPPQLRAKHRHKDGAKIKIFNEKYNDKEGI